MPDLKGSPPLTRGIPFFGMYVCVHVGFTPAHAGNTVFKPLFQLAPKVHPRSRGEYRYRNVCKVWKRGSPPLTRGIPNNGQALMAKMRFTPAHAGNTIKAAAKHFSYFAAASLSSMYPEHYLILFLRITLPLITTLWISLVPSKIWKIFASRISFSTG